MAQSAEQHGPAPGQGLNEYCQQMKAMGGASGTQNNTASGVCYQAYTNCTSSCEGMAYGYSGQAAEMMMATANGCRSYQAKVSQLASQSTTSTMAGSSGDMCNNVSSAAPQNSGGSASPEGSNNQNAANSPNASNNPNGASSNDPYGCQSNPSGAGCQQCSANPNSPACRALAYEKEVKGEASFGQREERTKKEKGGFDLPDTAGSSAYAGNGEIPAGAQSKNGTIANNSGGSIPGSGGGAPAKMDPKGGGSPGSPGYTTDILNGLNSPSGYSAPAGDGSTDDGGGGFSGYGGGPGVPATDQNGIDLRRFLPGNDKYPMRKGAGGIDIYSAQINGKFVNIWNRISERMQEKCRLGELISCDK